MLVVHPRFNDFEWENVGLYFGGRRGQSFFGYHQEFFIKLLKEQSFVYLLATEYIHDYDAKKRKESWVK